jgi:putative toxin-antitoxin system antitoxin component (TIGR02293 family)
MTTTFTPDTAHLLAVLRGRRGGRASAAYSAVHSLLDLDDVAREGLPKESLTAVVDAATRSASEAVTVRRSVIPDATWKRRTVRLNPAESDRTLRLARLVALTRHVWHDNADDVADFLSTPHALLGGRTPLVCSATDLGTEMVEGVLLRLMFGVAG